MWNQACQNYEHKYKHGINIIIAGKSKYNLLKNSIMVTPVSSTLYQHWGGSVSVYKAELDILFKGKNIFCQDGKHPTINIYCLIYS